MVWILDVKGGATRAVACNAAGTECGTSLSIDIAVSGQSE